jgi:Ca-activated chloride channel family protein
MSWADPWILALLAGVALLAGLRWWYAAWARRRVAASGAGHAVLAASVGRRRAVLRALLLWGGLAMAVVALAGPRWGSELRERGGRGADVMVLLDCSRSMLATDLAPDRMETARRKCLDLLHTAPHLRLGLMPFAATAVLRCPPTGDQQAMAELLRDCSPELFPAEAGLQGTAIGLGVREALAVLARGREPGQAVLIVSDGADPDPEAVRSAAAAAKDAGVPVFGLFVGDADSTAQVLIDGRQQRMTADHATLDALATATGALWVGATLDDRDVKTLAEAIDQRVAGREWQERRRTIAAERYRWLLLPAIGLIALGALLGTRRKL